MTTPSSHVPKPGTLWPPPRTATVIAWSAAKRTAVITSPALAGWTMTAGRLSIMPLRTARASSYPSSSGPMTVPLIASRIVSS